MHVDHIFFRRASRGTLVDRCAVPPTAVWRHERAQRSPDAAFSRESYFRCRAHLGHLVLALAPERSPDTSVPVAATLTGAAFALVLAGPLFIPINVRAGPGPGRSVVCLAISSIVFANACPNAFADTSPSSFARTSRPPAPA